MCFEPIDMNGKTFLWRRVMLVEMEYRVHLGAKEPPVDVYSVHWALIHLSFIRIYAQPEL